MVTLDGDFELFFAEKRDYNDSIKITLANNAESLSADVVWLFWAGNTTCPNITTKVIALAGNWDFEGDDWQTKLDISYSNNQTIISDTLGQSSSFVLDGNFDFDTAKTEFVTHNSGAEYLHLRLDNLEDLDLVETILLRVRLIISAVILLTVCLPAIFWDVEVTWRQR